MGKSSGEASVVVVVLGSDDRGRWAAHLALGRDPNLARAAPRWRRPVMRPPRPPSARSDYSVPRSRPVLRLQGKSDNPQNGKEADHGEDEEPYHAGRRNMPNPGTVK